MSRKFSNVEAVKAVAVGSLAFVEKVKGELGIKALHRELEKWVERMRCKNLVKLTVANLTPKVMR